MRQQKIAATIPGHLCAICIGRLDLSVLVFGENRMMGRSGVTFRDCILEHTLDRAPSRVNMTSARNTNHCEASQLADVVNSLTTTSGLLTTKIANPLTAATPITAQGIASYVPTANCQLPSTECRLWLLITQRGSRCFGSIEPMPSVVRRLSGSLRLAPLPLSCMRW
jgi:hypothetical protein